jgi:acid phosphatase (class A)
MGLAQVVVLGAVVVGASVAAAQQAPAPTPLILPKPYLGASAWPDASKILPAAPATGSPREAQDQKVFLDTRALEGSPRWALAQNDVPTQPAAMLKNFSCAVGADLSPATAPKLATLLTRVGLDMGGQVAAVKDVYKRPRPYLINEGPICTEKSAALSASPDYPSGHSTWGWAIGLILAELAPDRATAVMARGRAFGESRVICGVHSVSAVDAGRTNGGALVAALHGDPQFRADMEAARAELAALRQSSPAPTAPSAVCAAESDLVTKPSW